MALLLSPYRLVTDHIIIESLHIIKSAKGMDFTVKPLDGSELRKFYPNLSKDAREILQWFNKEGMEFTRDEIKKTFALQRGESAFEAYYKKAIIRRLYDLLLKFKPFAPQVKWYHKIKTDKGSFKTSPCVFSAYKPQLEFKVVKENDMYNLETSISINGSTYPYDLFNRYKFLLESGNEYFLLSYKDYQTLEWLLENDPAQYGKDPQELAGKVLIHLEADYKVNRNNLFTATVIEALPVNQVMLSEISNSFLVLTPKWLYEGFTAEGNWKAETEIIREGTMYLLRRNKEVEKEFVTLIESLHPNFPKQLNGYYYLSFADAQKKQWFLKVYHRLLELNIEVSGMDMLQHFRYSPHIIATGITFKGEEDQLVTLIMKVSFGEEEISMQELQKILLAGQRAILLKDGSLGILNEEWLAQYGTLIKHARITKKEMQVPRWLAFSLQKDTGALKSVLQNNWWQKWELWQQNKEDVYRVPAGVKAQLRPYQQRGFEWMLLLAEAGAGACLADDMGLGKTLQTICFLAYQSAGNPLARHLIVAPSSLIYNWQQELKRFAPHISSVVYHGAGRDELILQKDEHQIIITSYGTVRSDIGLMSAIHFNTVILDESHNIKNPSAQITMAAGNLKAATRIALSGTPVMNNTFDLYAQMNFLLPGVFGSREFFKREYADPIDRWQDPEKIRSLQQLTAPFILRRTKEQVATDLPEKTETVMWCDMSRAQKELYDEIRDSIRSSLFLNIKSEGLNKSKLAVLQGMLKLRQVCNSPLLLPASEQSCADAVKLDLLLDELSNNLKQHKVLVFSQFTGMLDLIADSCRKQHIAYYHFDGQTPPLKRAEMVKLFQEEGNTVNVFLISLKAGNAGLNLTAADYVFLVDPWWNTAVQQQAIDRTHRIGQTKSVFAYKMICKDTIEEKIIQLQQRKKQLAEDLVSEDEGFVKSLTEEDVNFLFS